MWKDMPKGRTRNELRYYKPRIGGIRIMKSNIVEKCSQDSYSMEKEIARQKKLKFSWIGGLAEFQREYTSVELQEKASEWRVESALRKLVKNRKMGQEEQE